MTTEICKHKGDKMAVKKKNKVEKRNDLNEVRANHMTMQQLRFFAIYLSRINARDESTRRVRFPLSDFRKIMELGRLNIASLKKTTDGLLCQIVHVPTERGGYRSFQLFKECRVEPDEFGAWFVEIDAHDSALPLFFDFKERYFTYEVGNVLRLSSVNQMRLYEILKQRQHLKQPVVIPLDELRGYLGIRDDAYQRFGNFRVYVLDKTQDAIGKHTDIRFSYDLVKNGKKVVAVAFTIEKNTAAPPVLGLDEYIKALPEAPADPSEDVPEDDEDFDCWDMSAPLPGLDFADALPSGLSAAEVEALRTLAAKNIDLAGTMAGNELQIYDYLQEKTKMLYAQKRPVAPENYFSWLRKAVSENWT